jgi:hypothetical protein
MCSSTEFLSGVIKESEGLPACNLKDVEYVHLRCSDSVFLTLDCFTLLEFTIY